MSARTRILCFGNPLAGDDGFGQAVHAALSQRRLPPGVQACGLPVRGWDALDAFADCDEAIIVDIVESSCEAAGTVTWFEPAALVDDNRRGEHTLGLAGILRLLPTRLPTLPDIRILGVVPAAVGPCLPYLSAPVAAAVPRAIALLEESFS